MKKSARFETAEELLNNIEKNLEKYSDIESYIEESKLPYGLMLYMWSKDIDGTIKYGLKPFDSETRETLKSLLKDIKTTIVFLTSIKHLSLAVAESLFDGLLLRVEEIRENMTTVTAA